MGAMRLVALVLFALPILALTPQRQTDDLERLPSRPGDRCMVCDKQIDEHGLSILYEGRRVPLADEEMLQTFLDEPQRYFPKLQPRGALFHEESVGGAGLRFGWLIVGCWILIALLSGALAAHVAVRKGLPGSRWFFTGLALSIPGALWAMATPAAGEVELPRGGAKIRVTAAPYDCPACATANHPSATSCSACGIALSPTMRSDVERLSRS